VIPLTHSPFAVPLLECLFDRPILTLRELEGRRALPSRQTLRILLNKLKAAGILRAISESRGRSPEVLVFPELLNLCEGRTAF